jgi:glycosyltransferase involved in cell wall biosynthesis
VLRFFDGFDNPDAHVAIRATLDHVRPDVVHVQHLLNLSGELMRACRDFRIPVVVTLNDYWFLCHQVRLKRRDGTLCAGPAHGLNCAQCLMGPRVVRTRLNPVAVAATVYRFAYLTRQLVKAQRILCPSRFLHDAFVRNGVRSDRLVVCDYGTPAPPADVVARRAAPRADGPVRFGFLGSFIPDKGPHVLLDAFTRLAPGRAELHLFGAPVDPQYAATLRRAGERPDVHWRGPLAHAERWRALGEIDVLVVPSTWYENSPLTIHEALAVGVPVIGSALGGIPELVRHDVNGLTFPAGDAAALAACLQAAADDPGRRARWQAGIVPPKSMAAHAAEIETLYRELGVAARAARPAGAAGAA